MKKLSLILISLMFISKLSASELLKTDNGIYINYDSIIAFKNLSVNSCLVIIKNVDNSYEKYKTSQSCKNTIKNNTVVPTLEATGRYLNLYANQLPALLDLLKNKNNSNNSQRDSRPNYVPAKISPLRSNTSSSLSNTINNDNSSNIDIGSPNTLNNINR